MQDSSLKAATVSGRVPIEIAGGSINGLTGGEIEARIRDFVARQLLFSDNGYPYDDAVSFLNDGVIDSLGILELVAFTGREFGVMVDPAEVIPENFDSVNQLAAYVRRKQLSTREAP